MEEGIRRIVFLHVRGAAPSENQTNSGKGISLSVFRRVQILMEGLAEGEYRHSIGNKAGETQALARVYPPERIGEIAKLYKHCLGIDAKWLHQDVAYLDLRKELRRIRKEEPGSILDVTAVSKSLLGDIIASSIIEGIHRIYTFDLKKKPDFNSPWTMLYHDLQQSESGKREYDYVNIVETAVFRECARSILVRTPSLVSSVVAAVTFLFLALIVYFISGEGNRLVQATFVASAVAGLFSLYFNFFPPRR